jgi:hypothetical protein
MVWIAIPTVKSPLNSTNRAELDTLLLWFTNDKRGQKIPRPGAIRVATYAVNFREIGADTSEHVPGSLLLAGIAN